MQAEEVLSTDISYETRIEAALDISSSELHLTQCCCSNKYGLFLLVKESRIVVLRLADVESSYGSSSPADSLIAKSHQIEFDDKVHGIYLSPQEQHICVVLDADVIILQIGELMHEVSNLTKLQ